MNCLNCTQFNRDDQSVSAESTSTAIWRRFSSRRNEAKNNVMLLTAAGPALFTPGRAELSGNPGGTITIIQTCSSIKHSDLVRWFSWVHRAFSWLLPHTTKTYACSFCLHRLKNRTKQNPHNPHTNFSFLRKKHRKTYPVQKSQQSVPRTFCCWENGAWDSCPNQSRDTKPAHLHSEMAHVLSSWWRFHKTNARLNKIWLWKVCGEVNNNSVTDRATWKSSRL